MEHKPFTFLKKNYQILYSLILIIFIPIVLLSNTAFSTLFFKNAIDQSLYDKSIAIGEVINAGMTDILDSPEEMQSRLEKVKKFNSEIFDLSILIPQSDEGFVYAAAINKDIVGQKTTETLNFIAWSENNPVAILTTIPTEKLFDTPNRFWEITMPLKDSSSKKQALLSMKISLATMDQLIATTLKTSYIILTIAVLVIMLLLVNNTRLFEYASLYKKLKEVDEMKDEFISIASHELRTPVTGIKGYVSMIIDGSFGEVNQKVMDSLKMVASASDRLGKLVEDLLNVSRIEQERLKVSLAPMNINNTIKETVAELKIQADEKKLYLQYKPHTEKLPLIDIDEDHLKQVLINLIGNSIKYTMKGGVEITTDTRNKGKELEIKIKDTGIGMSAKARERLFEKFYRVKNEKTANIVGTGLGLWITKQLVELMKGEIAVDSMEDVGTQVTLTFPTVKK